MGYRRSKARIAAARAWASFVARNAPVIRQAGLPEAVLASLACWEDFLVRGQLECSPDRAGFLVTQLSETQYGALTQLVDSYFAAGYEYFLPLALRSEDQQVLTARYGPPAR
jgi:hypothetical protein